MSVWDFRRRWWDLSVNVGAIEDISTSEEMSVSVMGYVSPRTMRVDPAASRVKFLVLVSTLRWKLCFNSSLFVNALGVASWEIL
jgi:hypothetical protein